MSSTTETYDLAKGTTDDHTDSHVEYIATHGELLEFIHEIYP